MSDIKTLEDIKEQAERQEEAARQAKKELRLAKEKLKAEQLAAKELERQEKAAEREAKQSQKEELSNAQKYKIFKQALQVYENTGMSFIIDGQPKYFYKLTTTKQNARTKKEESCTELKYINHGTLYPNWTELEHPYAKTVFRKMINGEAISVVNEEDVTETYQFKSRVYSKLVNTVDIVDENTYNTLDTSRIMQPSYNPDEIQQCPLIMRALLFALSGNTIHWSESQNDWVGDKPENLEFLEKWSYGALHAAVGNNMLSMPIIFGSGKVGRNSYFEIVFGNILGGDLRFSGVWDVIDSSFNAFKLGKVFIFIDEIPERGEWNKVKNATGSLKDYIKQKYGAELEVDNCIVYAMGSNQVLFPLPFEDGPQMMRVSPIKAVKTSTFAENTVKILDRARGSGYCRKLLEDAGIDTQNMDDFAIGDAVLRGPLAEEWQSRLEAQQLLNYFDQKYKRERYHLAPLRGQDWEEITEYKKDAVKATAEFIIGHDPEIISTHEIYEIYRIIQSERNSTMSKQLASVTESIRSYMENAGYTWCKNATIADNAQTNIFRKSTLVRGGIANYEEDFKRYILDEMVNGRPMRRLKGLRAEPDVKIRTFNSANRLF